jgi:hypothetical protein
MFDNIAMIGRYSVKTDELKMMIADHIATEGYLFTCWSKPPQSIEGFLDEGHG